MYPLNEMLTDLHAAGFAPKELTAMKEAQISHLYDSLIIDKIFWESRLQKLDPEHPEYPNPEISLAQTSGGMSADERATLRTRISKV
ncbi:MAG: hypothetical protein WB729_06720 [Candidatus Sulfotelmatobacter sp.]